MLRQDYVALSDRIAQRMAQVEQEEDGGPMSVAEMALGHQGDREQCEQEHSNSTVVNEDGEYCTETSLVPYICSFVLC